MSFRHRKTAFVLFSALSLTLTACQANSPASTPPAMMPSNDPGASPTANPGTTPTAPVTPNGGESPNPGVSSTPVVTPSSNPNTGNTTTFNLPNGTRLVVSLPNRFLSSKGQTVQLSVQLRDASGNELSLNGAKLLYRSSRPEDFSISDSGLVMALKDSGFSNLTVAVEGTDLSFTQLISVDTFVGSSGGGGGGGGVPPQIPTTTVNATVNFEGLGLGEFRVNTSSSTTTTDARKNAAVAKDSDGDFVVVWQSNNQDGGAYGIYAQRYQATGFAEGPEFRVNTYTTGGQLNPAVAMDAAGDFVVTWQSYGQEGSFGISAQRYNAAGVAQGSEFQVNTYTVGQQTTPALAMDTDGDFVVTWQSNTQDGSGYGVHGQRYNAAGVAQGSEFQVNTYTFFDQNLSSVAMDADGDFVVAWQSRGQDGHYAEGIFSRRYNAEGVAQGSEFQVNTYTTFGQTAPAVARDGAGDFVVTWQSSNQDGSGYGVYGQRYNVAGVAQGSEFRVNTYTTSQQLSPAVAMDTDGDFVVAWQSNGQSTNNKYNVYAQRYNATGEAQGVEFKISAQTAHHRRPAVAMDAAGDFVVVWATQNLDKYNVYGKQYTANGMAK